MIRMFLPTSLQNVLGDIIILAVIIAVVYFLMHTFKFKNPLWRWMLILIPPLLLIPMVCVPFDVFTDLLWYTVALIFLFSCIKVVLTVIKLIRFHDTSLYQHLVRPGLAILSILIVSICIYASLLSADRYALKFASEMQSRVDTAGVCPKNIDNWSQNDEGYSCRWYGKYGAKYAIFYWCSDDEQQFGIYVWHRMNYRFVISGGVGRKLLTSMQKVDEELTVSR
jgi:hypothetical protein